MPLMSTQELDARFAVFLNPIRDLTKNWEVDIAKYLEEYLEELAELQITFDEGETLMNFAEAAMLIQGSATVYSKKVEFLWQMVLQMLDLLSSKRNIECGNDPKVGGSSGRGNSSSDAPNFSCIDDLGMSKNINMKMDDDDMEEERERGFRFLAATPLHLVEKEGEKAQYRINLFMKNWDTFGVKDDFRINRSYLTPQGLLCLEFPVELLQKRSTMGILPEEEEVKSTGTPEPLPDLPEEPAVEDDIESDLPPPDLHGPGDIPSNEEPMEQDKEGNNQKDNEELNKNNNNIANSRKDQTVIELSNGKYGLRKRNDEKQAIITLKLTDPWVPLDPHSLTPSRRPVRAGRLRKPLPCSCHKALEKKSRKGRKGEEEETKEEKSTKEELSIVGNFITRGITSSVIETSVKKDKALMDLQVDANKEAVKRLEMTRRRMTRQMMKEKETLESAQERVEEEMQLEQENGEDFGCDGEAAVDMGDDIPAVPLFLPDPHSEEIMLEGGRVERLNAIQGDEVDSEYEKLVQKLVTDYISSAHEYIASSELTSRVNRWKENVLPVLEDEERRKEFDIHRYGTQVLAHFPDNGRKQTIPFASVVQGMGPKETSRLFLSCLMLANTYNVEISQSEEGDDVMDCMELTLLSRVRHHEELQEYAAPSQASPSKRKGRGKGSGNLSSNPQDEMCMDQPLPICADITHLANGDLNAGNIPSKKQAKISKIKTKR